jgi:DNA-binding Lrp family transcriptional regulator
VAKAYILITTRAGEIDVVREKLSRHEHITCADPIIGPYDIIALVETDDYTEIGTVVLRFVHELSGVEKTTTCMVIDPSSGADGAA